MLEKKAYECPRCSYKSKTRHGMKLHLVNRKNLCPCTKYNLELTPEVIEFVLKNRIYNVLKKTEPKNAKLSNDSSNVSKIIHNTLHNSHILTNNNTTIQYFITTLDPVKKMEYHHEFINNKNPQSIEDLISDRYEEERNDMLDGRGNYLYSFNDLTNMISEVSRMKDMSEFKDCVLIDKKGSDQIICYNESNSIKPEWEKLEGCDAAKFLVKIVQDQFLKNYECYIIRKIENSSMNEKCLLIEHLEIYYEFISIFDLHPWVFESTSDSQVLFNFDDDNYDIISSGTLVISKHIQKYKRIVKDNNSKIKSRMCSLFECIIRDNSRNSHEKFDAKVMNDYTKDPNYMRQMQNRFQV